jgi:hypothetical protein
MAPRQPLGSLYRWLSEEEPWLLLSASEADNLGVSSGVSWFCNLLQFSTARGTSECTESLSMQVNFDVLQFGALSRNRLETHPKSGCLG